MDIVREGGVLVAAQGGRAVKFRKKPVVIDAYEFHNRVGPDTRPDWLMQAVADGRIEFHGARLGLDFLTIQTLEGQMRAEVGDYIIRGVQGELYPCKPDIFAATYEPAEPKP